MFAKYAGFEKVDIVGRGQEHRQFQNTISHLHKSYFLYLMLFTEEFTFKPLRQSFHCSYQYIT